MEIVHDEPRRVMAVEINVPVRFPVGVGSGRTWKTLTECFKLKLVFLNTIRYLEGFPKHAHNLKYEPEVRVLNSSSMQSGQ